MVKLKLRSEPRPVYFPAHQRDPEKIEASLRTTIKSCVNGLSPWPLVLIGPSGVGKTCAALCVADRCYVDLEKTTRPGPNGKQVEAMAKVGGLAVYFVVQEALSAVIAVMKSAAKTTEFWKRWETAALSVLDEIGSREKVTDHHYNTVKQLIDLRAGKPSIVISNLDLPALAMLYDDRITSRLAGGTVVIVDGDDRRVTKG